MTVFNTLWPSAIIERTYADGIVMTDDDLRPELEPLRRENEALKKGAPYPRPDRSGYRLNLVQESENEWLDVGWNEGVLSDGRPYRMEVWKQSGMTAAHYFFSTRDLEDLTSDSCCDLLERENLVQFSPTSRRVNVLRGFDTIGQSTWAVTVLFGDANGRYANPKIGLLPYAQPE